MHFISTIFELLEMLEPHQRFYGSFVYPCTAQPEFTFQVIDLIFKSLIHGDLLCVNIQKS